MDNVQNCDSYINIPSSQTYRSKLRDGARKRISCCESVFEVYIYIPITVTGLSKASTVFARPKTLILLEAWIFCVYSVFMLA
jgi:hypothetical protein